MKAASSSFKTTATPRTDSNREGDATTADRDCMYNRHHNRSPDHATRTQLPSPHRRPLPDQHQRLPSHHLRRKPEKSLQHQRQIARSSIALTITKKNTRSTRNTPSRMLSATNHGKDVAIIKAQINPEEDEMNIDLPAYFLHRPWMKDWLLIKGPTSKYHHEEFYTKMEELAESGKSQKNIISWFGFLERSCGDPSGKYPFVRVEPH